MFFDDYTSHTIEAALRICRGIKVCVEGGDTEHAICYHWDDIEHDMCAEDATLSWKELTAIRTYLYQQWPMYSGNENYPVPATAEQRLRWLGQADLGLYTGEQQEMDSDAAGFAYDSVRDMWEGEYGALRMDLLNYMIATLEAQA